MWPPDYFSAAFGAVSVMAALHHRNRTGDGQVIDLGQVDAMAAVMGTVYLDYLVNGRVQSPMGNRHPYFAPHGCYSCKGHDAWCVIAVQNDDEWKHLIQATGNPKWASDPKFATMTDRLANVAELDRHIEDWTKDQTPYQVMQILQKASVPASAVYDGQDVFLDPHLRQRGFLVEVDDPSTGPVHYPASFVRLSETPSVVERCHGLGEDNKYVLGTIMGLPPAEIERLTDAGVLS